MQTRVFQKALLLLILISFSHPIFCQFYNGSQLSFGKNRVQYWDNFWTFYRFEKFDTYFYIGGKNLAIYTAKYAQENISVIEKKLNYNLENKIQFIIYNRLSDLKESNIGLVNEEQYNTGGITHIVGSKIFLYYNGNHENFKRQISASIVQIVLNNMMFGEQIAAKIKNTTLLTLPDWYLQGLISYLSTDWDAETDNYVKDGILSGNYEKFNNLSGADAINAGHSIWKYIANKYGEDKIPDILYMTKISKSVESGFLYVLGVSFKTFNRDWLAYYDKKYYDSDKKLSLPETTPLFKKKKYGRVFQEIKISPDGKYAAFVTNEIGKYKVWLYNFEKKKLKKLMKGGYKLDEKTDYSFPVLAWHPNSERLSIIREKKSKMFLYHYNVIEKEFEKQRIFDFQKILNFSYSQNGKLMVMSGVQNGQTDIFVYNLGSHTYEQITKDIYDDLNPVFSNNSKQIIFSSNRTNDSIKRTIKDSIVITKPELDLYLYDYANKKNVLRQITCTSFANETKPLVLENDYISFISDQNGINNFFVAKLDSTINYIDTTTHYRYYTSVFPQTNYSRNILDYDVCPESGKKGEIIYNNGLYKIYIDELPKINNLSKIEINNTTNKNEVLKTIIKDNDKFTKTKLKNIYTDTINKNKLISVNTKDIITPKQNIIDINNYTFTSDIYSKGREKKIKKDSISKSKTDTTKLKTDTLIEFKLPKQQNYDVEYSIDQFVNQVNFSYLNNTYQQFSNIGSPIYINPGFNALFKIGITDLLEDYRITGGVRLSVDMGNTEYILSFENLRKRIDKQLLFHRQSLENTEGSSIVKHHTNEVFYMLKYPLNQVMSLKGTSLIRNDQAVYLSTDLKNLKEPNIYKTWAGLKAELVFDNTRNKGLNLYYGTRYKLFAEVYRQLDEKNKQLNVVGFDFRNYQKISRTFIWANRIAGSTSFGTQKLVYYMGGVDNWLFPKFNNNINVATDQNYAYQTLATNLRGFSQNIRNGNSFIVINSEFRLPVFRYFVNRPLKSELFNNFQIVAFGDIGTAWTGINPYSDKNSLYTKIYQQGPITVTIKTQNEPIVGGYGVGLRTKILGYFVRADLAWGVEDAIVLPKVFYLSLGLDF